MALNGRNPAIAICAAVSRYHGSGGTSRGNLVVLGWGRGWGRGGQGPGVGGGACGALALAAAGRKSPHPLGLPAPRGPLPALPHAQRPA
jgi:hypothetical protein